MFKAIVPVPVIVPPVKPVPAATDVTVPVHCVMAVHLRPEEQVESATRTCPSVPTAKAVGVDAAVPVTIAPLPETQAQGIADDPLFEIQQSPVEAVEQATKT